MTFCPAGPASSSAGVSEGALQHLKILLLKAKAEQLTIERENVQVALQQLNKLSSTEASGPACDTLSLQTKVKSCVGPQLKKHVQQLKQDLQQLQKKSDKLEYRVEHLKDSVSDGDKTLTAVLRAGPESKHQLLQKYDALLRTQATTNGIKKEPSDVAVKSAAAVAALSLLPH